MKPDKWSIFDIHCHPSLKYSILAKEKFYNAHTTADGITGFMCPLGVYYDAPGAKNSKIKVIVNAHYVPENGFRKSVVLDALGDAVIEAADSGPTNDSAWSKLQCSIKRLNELVDETNRELGPKSVCILSAADNLDAKVEEYDLVIINGIEGSHHLGRGLDEKTYLDRLGKLRKLGFCVFGLSHFFLNDVCDTAGGIPLSDYFVTGYNIPNREPRGLTPIGKNVVKFALQNNFLIDLVHSTVETRQQVYQINKDLVKQGILKTLRPLAFTHTGILQQYKCGADASTDLYGYLANDDDIKEIKECNGIMGIILMKDWLIGQDDDDPISFDVVADIINYINVRTSKAFDNVCIGTDLDGFTHVPDNLRQCSMLGPLAKYIIDTFGEENGQKILFGNACRVIKECCF